MEHSTELDDDYAHTNEWGRELLRNFAKDLRKLFPNQPAAAPKLTLIAGRATATGTPQELVSQSVQGSSAVRTEAVGGE